MMSESEPMIDLESVRDLVMEGYIPFAEIDRAVTWPDLQELLEGPEKEDDVALRKLLADMLPGLTERSDRMENDAEHSFSLALVGCSIGNVLGLDTGKIAQFATLHDFPELVTGDASIWDQVGHAAKEAGEDQAIEVINELFGAFPWLKQTILEYNSMVSEEARLVYALDKLLALLIIFEGGGKFWKNQGITFEQHIAKANDMLPKVARHPVILDLYEQVMVLVAEDKDKLFAKPSSPNV